MQYHKKLIIKFSQLEKQKKTRTTKHLSIIVLFLILMPQSFLVNKV